MILARQLRTLQEPRVAIVIDFFTHQILDEDKLIPYQISTRDRVSVP
jgi:hypothetical protein